MQMEMKANNYLWEKQIFIMNKSKYKIYLIINMMIVK